MLDHMCVDSVCSQSSTMAELDLGVRVVGGLQNLTLFLSSFFFFLQKREKFVGPWSTELGNWGVYSNGFPNSQIVSPGWHDPGVAAYKIILSGLWGSLERVLQFGQGVVLGRCLP